MILHDLVAEKKPGIFRRIRHYRYTAQLLVILIAVLPQSIIAQQLHTFVIDRSEYNQTDVTNTHDGYSFIIVSSSIDGLIFDSSLDIVDRIKIDQNKEALILQPRPQTVFVDAPGFVRHRLVTGPLQANQGFKANISRSRGNATQQNRRSLLADVIASGEVQQRHELNERERQRQEAERRRQEEERRRQQELEWARIDAEREAERIQLEEERRQRQEYEMQRQREENARRQQRFEQTVMAVQMAGQITMEQRRRERELDQQRRENWERAIQESERQVAEQQRRNEQQFQQQLLQQQQAADQQRQQQLQQAEQERRLREQERQRQAQIERERQQSALMEAQQRRMQQSS